MVVKIKKFLSELNSTYIIILGCLLGLLLLLNSNHINSQEAKMKLDKEQNSLSNQVTSKRKLEQTLNITKKYNSYVDHICSLGSEELINYYKTSDLSGIELEDEEIKCDDCEEEYMKALIGLVKNFVLDEKNDDEREENLKIYGKRILPIAIFMGIGALFIFGYIFCLVSCCCNCCCCCCCKKPGCKIPCFIFNFLLNILAFSFYIYIFTQIPKLFKGLADTECSLMQIFDQMLKGERKENTPKWLGLEKIENILDNLEKDLQDFRDDNIVEMLNFLRETTDDERNKFMLELKNLHKNFYQDDGITPLEKYHIKYETSPYHFYKAKWRTKFLRGSYTLDLIPALGKYNDETQKFEPGFISDWNNEICELDNQTDQTLSEGTKSLENILGDKLEDFLNALRKRKDQLGKIKVPFDDLYEDIFDIIFGSSQIIDENGKLVLNLFLGVMIVLIFCLDFLLIFICLCSGKSCSDNCFCRIIIKYLIHIVWMTLAKLTIFTFLIGSFLALLGRIGGDMYSVISYIVSEENFDQENPVLLDELKEGKEALKECIFGDGDLSIDFSLDNIRNDFDIINTKKWEIRRYKEKFKDLALNLPTYNKIKQNLINKAEFIEDTGLVYLGSNIENDLLTNVNLSQIITALNEAIGETNIEKWDQLKGDKNFVCSEGKDPLNRPNENLLHPWTCEPNDRDWVSSSDEYVINFAQIATDIIKLLKEANKTSNDGNDYYNIMKKTKESYIKFLDSYLKILEFFEDINNNIFNLLEEGIGSSNDTFSFMNGKFIKTNIRILLKNLKYSLGKDIYNIGIYLIVPGFLLMISISTTLLLLVIINLDEQNLQPQKDIPNLPEFNGENILKYQY